MRAIELPGVPRVGEMVEVNPNWEPVAVVTVEWFMDVEVGEPHVVLHLDSFDEDHVGQGSLIYLLDAGWRPAIEGL